MNILSESDFYERKREEAEAKVEVSKLPIGEATIQKLITADFRFVQDILEVTPSRLTEIDGIGPKKADQIIEAAREYMFELQTNKTEAEQLESEEKDEEERVRGGKTPQGLGFIPR